MSQSRRNLLNSETCRLLAQLWSRSTPACETDGRVQSNAISEETPDEDASCPCRAADRGSCTVIAKRIAEHQPTARKRDLSGLGPIAAGLLILTFLPEIGTLNREPVRSLTGRAPTAVKCGSRRGSPPLAVDASPCTTQSICRHWWPWLQSQPQSQIRRAARGLGNQPRSQSSPSCASSETANALLIADRLWCKNSLAHDGYSFPMLAINIDHILTSRQ